MSKLQPTLWRTCRVLANETRLRLLWTVFEDDQLSVAERAGACGIQEAFASTQLRALNARGLITPKHAGNKLFYRAEANQSVPHAGDLLQALRTVRSQNMPMRRIIKTATGFTHPRRIVLARELSNSEPTGLKELAQRTQIPVPALRRHLNKLRKRGFIRQHHRTYRLNQPHNNALAHRLLRIACTEPPEQ